MCDYSLEGYRTRPAQEGERYQTHRFPSHSIGFVAPSDTSTAVCMACDMRIRLEGIPEHLQRSADVSANEVVTFVRLDTNRYRDGVRFDSGTEVTLQRLGTGVKAHVVDALTLPQRELAAVESA